MDERSSECKRTDRACDMLEKGVVFFDWHLALGFLKKDI